MAKGIGIVATASLPWLTGASIAPLFHGVYLKKKGYRVILYLPWTPPGEQKKFLGAWTLRQPRDLTGYLRLWLPEELRPFLPEIRRYPAWYSRLIKSVLPVKDLDTIVREHDVTVLEEPEHLFWCHPWSGFKRRRQGILGIVLTNYAAYHAHHLPDVFVRLLRAYSLVIMQRVCHRIIAIAPVEPRILAMENSRVSPVNAVRDEFFRPAPPARSKGCYFMGKLIPEKGLKEMFAGLGRAGVDRIDLFGNGEKEMVQKMAAAAGVTPVFMGETNQPWADASGYRVFVNCSKSEYFCTTTANALAMQQWVILPRHPSNRIFYPFKNCLTYRDADGLLACLSHALSCEPVHDPLVRSLSWEVAAGRLEREILALYRQNAAEGLPGAGDV